MSCNTGYRVVQKWQIIKGNFISFRIITAEGKIELDFGNYTHTCDKYRVFIMIQEFIFLNNWKTFPFPRGVVMKA